jgi:hypothetical protein
MPTDLVNIRNGAGDPVSPRQQSILDSFDYHRPSPEQGDRIGRARAAFKRCALTVLAVTPEGADQTAALRQLHEAMMTANKAIALEPGTPIEPTLGEQPWRPREFELPPLAAPSGASLRLPDDDPNPGV